MKTIMPQNKIYTHRVPNMKFGSIPKSVLQSVMSDGRILGQIMEFEVANSFHGFTKYGVNTKSTTEDLFYGSDKQVQCKSVNLSKNSNAIVQSCLWDTDNGVRRTWSEWDRMHNEFYQKADFLMFMEIGGFADSGNIDMLFITPEHFKNTAAKFTEDQRRKMHTRRMKKFNQNHKLQVPENANSLLPNWEYPVKMTNEMWEFYRRD